MNTADRSNGISLAMSGLIDGLHCRHVGEQNKRKFAHVVCI